MRRLNHASAHRGRTGSVLMAMLALLATSGDLDGQSTPAAPTPPISTTSLSLDVSWDECRGRVARALAAEGYASDVEDLGNSWQSRARGGAAAISCIAGNGETVVVITTTGAGAFDVKVETSRLLDRMRAAGTSGGPASKPPQVLGQGWATNPMAFRGQIGQRFTIECPAGGPARNAWGVDLYTDDSSVCTAGVHAGAITLFSGGTVTIEVRPGLPEYDGSERNGVKTDFYPAWEGSFVVVGNTPMGAAPVGGGSGWNATASRYRGQNGERVAFSCPAGGPAGGVWGTDVYADESSVCAAAVHSGLLTIFSGGNVVIEIRAGEASYRGSNRNGITSESFGAAAGSFVFVK